MAEAQLDDYDFSTTSSGASATFPMEAGQIRKGGYVFRAKIAVSGLKFPGALFGVDCVACVLWLGYNMSREHFFDVWLT